MTEALARFTLRAWSADGRCLDLLPGVTAYGGDDMKWLSTHMHITDTAFTKKDGRWTEVRIDHWTTFEDIGEGIVVTYDRDGAQIEEEQ